ncbi:MAG: hypothetical protein NC432_13525 [Roseburia sp.]|nr:hypothetical protein [Roseburia sp.]MCM1098777.1 hypothetical protein [Ruminococcus flavefaciens]MCM1235990.1 hypothetical protein [Ruminococcus flavefaciens]
MDYNEMSTAEKERYIRDNFSCVFCGYNMDKIDRDANLTESQKKELKDYLLYYGD